MSSIEVYIKHGYEVKNALIENADITTEEYPTVNIQLKLPGGGVVFGGYSFAHVTKGDFKLEGWEKDFYREHKSRIDLKTRYSRQELEQIEQLQKLLT